MTTPPTAHSVDVAAVPGPNLVCVACATVLTTGEGPTAQPASLTCATCGRVVPIEAGIPRFVDTIEDELSRRTQESFGYEWTHFGDWRPSGSTNFNDYFQGLDLSTLNTALVLDAGCGMGRHARQLAPHVGRLVAVDFSRAIDQAARNTAGCGNVTCVQADLLALPLPNDAFDFVYSLGVLHHLTHTERALAQLVAKLKPGGRLRVYLYWRRHGLAGALLGLVTMARRVTTRLPLALLRALCLGLSVGLFLAVVLPYRLLSRLGISGHASWPLFVYSKYPFTVLYNDQFDRFSAPLEKRYDAHEAKALLAAAGLREIRIAPCFGWIVEGTKPT